MEQTTPLSEYAARERLRLADLAALLGTSVGYAHDLKSGRRDPSPTMAVRIERATNGEITREQLRPDLFQKGPADAVTNT